MPRSRNETSDRLLTAVELELMTIVWAKGSAAVKDVAAALPKSRRLAYTSVATMLKILEQKNFLRCEKDAHAHVFVPIVTKDAYEGACIDHMVSNVFDGEPAALVQRLLSVKHLSPSDLAAIEAALRKLAPKGGRKE